MNSHENLLSYIIKKRADFGSQVISRTLGGAPWQASLSLIPASIWPQPRCWSWLSKSVLSNKTGDPAVREELGGAIAIAFEEPSPRLVSIPSYGCRAGLP